MGYVIDRPSARAFFDELGVSWSGIGSGPHAGTLKTPDMIPDRFQMQWRIFSLYAAEIEQAKHMQSRKGDPLGYGFPVYDHPSVFVGKDRNPVFVFTPYHSTSIIGFMPMWMHLSDNPWYMGERAIYANASEIPLSADLTEIDACSKLPPLVEMRDVKSEILDGLRRANRQALVSGRPFVLEART